MAQAEFSRTLTQEQNKALDNYLTTDDFWVMSYKVSRLRGLSNEEANSLIKAVQKEREDNIQTPVIPNSPEACDHQIFQADGGNLRGSNGSWINALCDNQPNDDDWVFQFPFVDGPNVDIRWWSNDGWVRTVLHSSIHPIIIL